MKPSRALWVSFYLGRPYGVPNDPEFQRDVLRAALDLLPTATRPTIADYPVDAPDDAFSDSWTCPVAFAPSDADTLAGRLRAEVQGLAPWWRETNRARGRSLIGTSGAGPEQIEALAETFAALGGGAPLDTVPAEGAEVPWTHAMPILVRHIYEDLRCYYLEASASQPGVEAAPSHRALNNWIFHETVLGEAVIEVGRRITESGEARLLMLRGLMIPEGFWPDGHTWGLQATEPNRMATAAERLDFLAGRS